MRLWYYAPLIVVLGSAPAGALQAQEVQPVAPGDTVRVWSSSLDLEARRATVLPWSAPVARFASTSEPFDSLAIPFSRLTRLDVLDGRNHARGILLGAAVGGSLGFLIGILVGEAAVRGCQEFLCGLEALNYAGGGFLIGGVLGGAIGAANPPARWRRVELPTEAGFPPYSIPWYNRIEIKILSLLLGAAVAVAVN